MENNKEKVRYKHLFGPVSSRRLGRSLGIDLVPFKTCSLDCIYCECGKTTTLTTMRKPYISASEIIVELDNFLESNPDIDIITFGGSGEPTLNSETYTILQYIKARYPFYKTALLTNGTLLNLEEVREQILKFDCVLPSMDAISQSVFQKINQPVEILQNNQIIDGLITFSHEYSGILWVEIFIVPGINDNEEELALFKETLLKMSLERVQLNTLDRPPAYSWVKPASHDLLVSIANYLLPLPVEIIARNLPSLSTTKLDKQDFDYIIDTIKRRPLTIEELSLLINKNLNETSSILDNLISKNIITREKIGITHFYKIK